MFNKGVITAATIQNKMGTFITEANLMKECLKHSWPFISNRLSNQEQIKTTLTCGRIRISGNIRKSIILRMWIHILLSNISFTLHISLGFITYITYINRY